MSETGRGASDAFASQKKVGKPKEEMSQGKPAKEPCILPSECREANATRYQYARGLANGRNLARCNLIFGDLPSYFA